MKILRWQTKNQLCDEQVFANAIIAYRCLVINIHKQKKNLKKIVILDGRSILEFNSCVFTLTV